MVAGTGPIKVKMVTFMGSLWIDSRLLLDKQEDFKQMDVGGAINLVNNFPSNNEILHKST